MKGRHPKHPKCPGCGKALYKSKSPGASTKTTDPYRYCRNRDCLAHRGLIKLTSNNTGDKINGGSVVCTPDLAVGTEPEVVRQARVRISKAISGELASGQREMIGLTLALLAQEVGHRDMANRMIDEYDLTNRYGITKDGGGK